MFLLKKEAKVSWSIDIQVAFGCLEKGIHFSPILTQLDPTSVFIVEIDPLDFTVGIVLSQFTGPYQLLHPCAAFSWKQTPAEENYDLWDRELLAIRAAF